MKYDHAKPLIERLMHVAVLYHASSGMLRTKIFDALKEFIPDMDDGCFERGCPAIDYFSSHTTTQDDELKEMVEKGTKAWAGTPDNWVDDLRGGVEKQEPVAIGEEWKPCVKLPIIVHVREQRKGETHVSTREGITPVKEDDLIMRGVAGEEYPIGRELFNRTYTFDTAPVHAIDISQERVDETAKDRHEWVGLTDEERSYYLQSAHNVGWWQAAKFIEAKLKEKNYG